MCPFSSVIGVLHFGQVTRSGGDSILPLSGISGSGTIAVLHTPISKERSIMPKRKLLRFTLAATIAAVAFAQKDAPPNSQPNPYVTVENWAKMPEGRSWGST